MIVAVGTDIVEIARIERLVAGGDRFVARVFTADERAYCESTARPAASFAARFCAKEAVMKCLGTGWTQGVEFQAIEVVRNDAGAVSVQLTGVAGETAAALGIARIHLSLSHGQRDAVAFAVAESD